MRAFMLLVILLNTLGLTGCNTAGSGNPELQNTQPSRVDVNQEKLQKATTF